MKGSGDTSKDTFKFRGMNIHRGQLGKPKDDNNAISGGFEKLSATVSSGNTVISAKLTRIESTLRSGGITTTFSKTQQKDLDRKHEEIIKSLKSISSGRGGGGNGEGGGSSFPSLPDWMKPRGRKGPHLPGRGPKPRGGLLRGLTKKIPFIGAAIEAGRGAWDAYKVSQDDNLTDTEKEGKYGNIATRTTGGAIGSVAGGLAGGALGTFLGPAGTLAGEALGSAGGAWLGDKLGSILGDKLEHSILEAGGFKNFVDESKTKFSESITSFSKSSATVLSNLATVGDSFSKSLSNWFHSDTKPAQAAQKAAEVLNYVKNKASEAVSTVKTQVSSAAKAVGNAVQQTADKASAGQYGPTAQRVAEGTKQAGETIRHGYTAAKDWVLGKTSSMFESSGKADTISSGRGDRGGVSYGLYQLSSKTGTLNEFLNKSGYKDQFGDAAVGSKEFNDKWKALSKDQKFVDAQHEFIKSTHYDKQLAKLKKSGIDLSSHGSAVQDAVWSTSVQFGGGTGLIEKALAGKDVSKMSDAEIVSAIQDYKIANNGKLFASSSDKVRAGTLNRASKEKAALIALASAPGVTDVNHGIAKPVAVQSGVEKAKMFAVNSVQSAPTNARVEMTAPHEDISEAMKKMDGVDHSEKIGKIVAEAIATVHQSNQVQSKKVDNTIDLNDIPMIPQDIHLAMANMGHH